MFFSVCLVVTNIKIQGWRINRLEKQGIMVFIPMRRYLIRLTVRIILMLR